MKKRIIVLIFAGEGSLHVFFFLGAFVALLLGIPLHVAAAIRWGTTWYAVGRRSIRTRTGLWTITEATVTYDNVQNVKLKQGPLQRAFGISSLEIETAGGSSKSRPTTSNPGLKALLTLLEVAMMFLPGGAAAGAGFGNFGGNKGPGKSPGTMEGLGDARAVRETILRRVRRSRGAGLGDDRADAGPRRRITPEQVAEMRRIRDALSGL